MRNILLGLALVIIGLPATLYAVVYTKVQWDNFFYARSLFKSDDIEITRIIGSKRWHHLSEGPFACTFAVVEISPASTAALVARRSTDKIASSDADSSSFSAWLSDHAPWVATPISRKRFNQSCSDIPRECCLDEFSDSDGAAIMTGLDSDGGFVVTTGESTRFFLPNRNILGQISFTD